MHLTVNLTNKTRIPLAVLRFFHTGSGTARHCAVPCDAVSGVKEPCVAPLSLKTTHTELLRKLTREGLAVASIARDDPSTLPGDDPFPRARMHGDRNAR